MSAKLKNLEFFEWANGQLEDGKCTSVSWDKTNGCDFINLHGYEEDQAWIDAVKWKTICHGKLERLSRGDTEWICCELDCGVDLTFFLDSVPFEEDDYAPTETRVGQPD